MFALLMLISRLRKQQNSKRLQNVGTSFQIKLMIHMLCFEGQEVDSKNNFSSTWKWSQGGAWWRLDWGKFMNCSLTEHRLPRMAGWQIKHKDKSERQSTNILIPAPFPFSSAVPSAHPFSHAPSTRLPFSPLSPYVYESVTMATSPQGQRVGGCLRIDK